MALPAFLIDYNSFQNPLLMAFLLKVTFSDDKLHRLGSRASISLGCNNKRGMIDPATLKQYGGKEIRLKKDDIIFHETEKALNYFQVLGGAIKMITTNSDGKEFIQGIFRANDSFGEPPLFGSFVYPSTAMAMEPSTLIKLPKEKFFKMLRENFEIHLHLDKVLCERLKYKSMVLSEISFYDPEHRIMSLLNHMKGGAKPGVTSMSSCQGQGDFIVPYTRQQLADMSGLRVETVIRTVKKMEDEGKLRVVSRKIAI